MDDRTTMGTTGGSHTGGADGAADKARELKDKGEHLIDEGKEKARELGDQAVEVVRSRGDEQRERVAEGVRTFAYALRRGANDLPEDRREYGRFIDDVADRVESVSRYIEQRDVDSLTREARRFARDHTPVFLAGAFTLGMLGARFMKSSGDAARDDRYDRYDRGDRHDLGTAGRERWTSPYDQPTSYGRDEMAGRPRGRPEGDGYA
jgi:hypothetical protein